MDDIYLNI